MPSKMSKTKKLQSQSDQYDIDKNSILWKLFSAFLFHNKDTIAEDDLRLCVTKELDLSLAQAHPEFEEHLPAIMVTFLNIWSGWHFKGQFLSGKFSKEHYFHRFKKYIRLKMSSALNGQFAAAVKSLKEQERTVTLINDAEKISSEFAPYSIQIECPAQMLNTIVFSNVDDDIIMKQHLGGEWEDLTTTQLLNWPHVEVNFRTSDFWFVRRSATEYMRYLNFTPHDSTKNNDYIIEGAETLRTYGTQKRCVSYSFFQGYIEVYLHTLKKDKNVSESKIEEINAILQQFLSDVKYIDINQSMSTNTLVLFQLSTVPFIRNKKLVKNGEKDTQESRVGYCEIISPKIELLLIYFKAEQTDTPYLSFKFIEQLKKPDQSLYTILPSIVYKCLFCKIEFTSQDSKSMMLEHLKVTHRMEQNVRCTSCKKQFEVTSLAAHRWKHNCNSK